MFQHWEHLFSSWATLRLSLTQFKTRINRYVLHVSIRMSNRRHFFSVVFFPTTTEKIEVYVFLRLRQCKSCNDLLKLRLFYMFTFRETESLLNNTGVFCFFFSAVAALLHSDFVRLVDISHPHIWILSTSYVNWSGRACRCSHYRSTRCFFLRAWAHIVPRSYYIQLTSKMCVTTPQKKKKRKKQSLQKRRITMLKHFGIV